MIVSNWRRENDVFRLDVTIPANTTATVYVRTKDIASVTESGRAAGNAPGVKLFARGKWLRRVRRRVGKIFLCCLAIGWQLL